MDILLVTALYISTLLLVVTALLFGQNHAFSRTPLPKIHWLLTEGLCDGMGVAAQRLGGRRGTACLAAAGELCCERSNPAIQLLFLTLLGGNYWLFWTYIFPMLPLPGVPAWHNYAGTAGALICLAFFLAACFADPGTITAANLAAYRNLYPYDDLLYVEKDCWTCGFSRPARSKHCRACGRCVARMDHHCIWLNSCVGLLNMRWFLGFLASTAALCFYAASLGFRVLRSDMRRDNTWGVAFMHPHTEQVVYLSDSWRHLLHYLSAVYGPQMAVTFFAGAAGWIVFGFLGYQLFLVCSGETTSEGFKRRELADTLRQQQEEAQLLEQRVERVLAGDSSNSGGGGAAAAAGGSGIGSPAVAGGGSGGSGSRAAEAGGSQRQHRCKQRLPNMYDRGVWQNLSEVLFPHHHLGLAACGSTGGKKQC